MPVVIAKKKIGRAQPGEKVKVGSNVVRAVLALGMAELLAPAVQGAPAPSAPKLSKHERRAYRRKDVAAAPAAAVLTAAAPAATSAHFASVAAVCGAPEPEGDA